MQLSDDAEEVQEEVGVAARAAEIAAEEATQGMTDSYALYSLLWFRRLICTDLIRFK